MQVPYPPSGMDGALGAMGLYHARCVGMQQDPRSE
jgi:hypothetical protein